MMVIFHAEPGSGDAEKLALLASVGLPTSQPGRSPSLRS